VASTGIEVFAWNVNDGKLGSIKKDLNDCRSGKFCKKEKVSVGGLGRAEGVYLRGGWVGFGQLGPPVCKHT